MSRDSPAVWEGSGLFLAAPGVRLAGTRHKHEVRLCESGERGSVFHFQGVAVSWRMPMVAARKALKPCFMTGIYQESGQNRE